jgi:hypothetical protein
MYFTYLYKDRKDIQIYRAVAFISVIIYHFNVDFLPLDYLDVDKKANLLYVDIFNPFCNSQYCNCFDDGEFLFIDGSHLSYLGAKNIVDNSDLSLLFNNS